MIIDLDYFNIKIFINLSLIIFVSNIINYYINSLTMHYLTALLLPLSIHLSFVFPTTRLTTRLLFLRCCCCCCSRFTQCRTPGGCSLMSSGFPIHFRSVISSVILSSHHHPIALQHPNVLMFVSRFQRSLKFRSSPTVFSLQFSSKMRTLRSRLHTF